MNRDHPYSPPKSDRILRRNTIVARVNCIYANWGVHLPAYVCLGFHQLNNEGLVGTCEADLLCAPTMLMMR